MTTSPQVLSIAFRLRARPELEMDSVIPLLAIFIPHITQLIQYLFDSKSKPGFILRHGNKFLYIYMILALIVMVMRNVYAIKYLLYADIANAQILFFSTSITSIVLFAAKALVLIGVAQFLKRLIPIIEEHKTLV